MLYKFSFFIKIFPSAYFNISWYIFFTSSFYHTIRIIYFIERNIFFRNISKLIISIIIFFKTLPYFYIFIIYNIIIIIFTFMIFKPCNIQSFRFSYFRLWREKRFRCTPYTKCNYYCYNYFFHCNWILISLSFFKFSIICIHCHL